MPAPYSHLTNPLSFPFAEHWAIFPSSSLKLQNICISPNSNSSPVLQGIPAFEIGVLFNKKT